MRRKHSRRHLNLPGSMPRCASARQQRLAGRNAPHGVGRGGRSIAAMLLPMVLALAAISARSNPSVPNLPDPWAAAPAAMRHQAFNQFLAHHRTRCSVTSSFFNGEVQLGHVRGSGWSVTCEDGRNFGLLIEPAPASRAWFAECALLARRHPTLRCFHRLEQ